MTSKLLIILCEALAKWSNNNPTSNHDKHLKNSWLLGVNSKQKNPSQKSIYRSVIRALDIIWKCQASKMNIVYISEVFVKPALRLEPFLWYLRNSQRNNMFAKTTGSKIMSQGTTKTSRVELKSIANLDESGIMLPQKSQLLFEFLNQLIIGQDGRRLSFFV